MGHGVALAPSGVIPPTAPGEPALPAQPGIPALPGTRLYTGRRDRRRLYECCRHRARPGEVTDNGATPFELLFSTNVSRATRYSVRSAAGGAGLLGPHLMCLAGSAVCPYLPLFAVRHTRGDGPGRHPDLRAGLQQPKPERHLWVRSADLPTIASAVSALATPETAVDAVR